MGQHGVEKGVECDACDFSSELDSADVQRDESPLVGSRDDHELLFKFGKSERSVDQFEPPIRSGSHGDTSREGFLG